VDPSLRARLQRLNAEFAALDLEPDKAVRLAYDLLVDGVDTPALCELAGESPTRLDEREAADLVKRALVELGIKPMTYDEADPFRSFAREYLRLADEELGSSRAG